MTIYTKKGDRGETGLFDGRRVPKNTALVEAIGAVDELNATLGVAADEVKSQKSKVKNAIQKIQSDLFVIGSQLAGYKDSRKVGLESRVNEMEKEIDRMWKRLPPLRNFILPQGQLHLARVVCRRAERAVVAAKAEFAYQYLNRLSDYLFCLARWTNFKSGKKEVLWKK